MTYHKHTPGPWTAETVKTSCGVCHRVGPFPSPEWMCRKKPSHACIYDDYPAGSGTSELVANAHLIAAAPEMYEALANHEIRLRHCSKNIEDEYPIWAGDLLKMADAALAVLSKARGESK